MRINMEIPFICHTVHTNIVEIVFGPSHGSCVSRSAALLFAMSEAHNHHRYALLPISCVCIYSNDEQ